MPKRVVNTKHKHLKPGAEFWMVYGHFIDSAPGRVKILSTPFQTQTPVSRFWRVRIAFQPGMFREWGSEICINDFGIAGVDQPNWTPYNTNRMFKSKRAAQKFLDRCKAKSSMKHIVDDDYDLGGHGRIKL